MNSSLKSAVLGVGLLVAAAATAQAQSVSSLPPTNPATVPPTATAPAASTDKIVPNPGNNSTWKEEHAAAAPAADNPGSHPYTIPHFGPAPN
jgi:hypothetical protein